MSSLLKSQDLSIEQILDEIRRQVDARPLTHAAERHARVCEQQAPESQPVAVQPGPAAGSQRDAGTAPSGAAAPDTGRTLSAALASMPLGISSAANDQDGDLPAMLRRVDGPAPQAAKVHRLPRSRQPASLRDALQRAVGWTSEAAAPLTVVAPTPPGNPPELPSAAAPADPPVKRQMTSFLDTRFKNMSSAPKAPAAITPAPAPALPAALPPLVQVPAVRAPAGSDLPLQALVDALVRADPHARIGSREQAAELLRPMLQQWLLENMPRLVERALSLEAQESPAGTGTSNDD